MLNLESETSNERPAPRHRENLKRRIKVNNGIDFTDLQWLDPRLVLVVADLSYFCAVNGQSFVLSSIIRSPKQDEILGAKSTTHSTGRAVDVSIRFWSPTFLNRVVSYLEKEHGKFGAVSAKTGDRRLVVVHNNYDGAGKHMHLQVDRSLT